MAGIYIHIPFCKKACAYCNFHFATSLRQKAALLPMLHKELILRKSYLKREKIESIYFGGGTPSLLSVEEIANLLYTIKHHYDCTGTKEVTLEANPDQISFLFLQNLYKVGINRISLGVQSFNDVLLKRLGRSHSSTLANAAIKALEKSDFTQYSIDLIYSIIGSDIQSWEKDITTALAMRPPHLSAYCLTIEPNTLFYHQIARKKISPCTTDQMRQQFDLLVTKIKEAGYCHYEVSNFCLPGHEAIHNSNYWKRKPYLGIGPSAHSYDGKMRHKNIAHNGNYISALKAGKLPITVEVLSRSEQINDYLLTGLRTIWGVDMAFLKKVWGYHLPTKTLQLLIQKGLLQQRKELLQVTEEGRFITDGIARELFC